MKHIMLVSLALIINSCNGQKKETKIEKKTENITKAVKNHLKKDTMEHFNIDKYKDQPLDKETGFYKLQNGDIVQVIDKTKNHGYVEKINKSKKPYTFYYEYHLNGSLKLKGKILYGLNIYVWQEFDINGNIIRETDYEKPYNFTIKDLIEKVKKEYKVDLEDKSQGGSIGRRSKNGIFYYEVNLDLKEPLVTKMQYILVDGTTGKTLFTKEYYTKGGGKNPFDQYLETLKTK